MMCLREEKCGGKCSYRTEGCALELECSGGWIPSSSVCLSLTSITISCVALTPLSPDCFLCGLARSTLIWLQGSMAVERNDGGFLVETPIFFPALSRLLPFHRDVIIGLRARASACASASRRPRSCYPRRLLSSPRRWEFRKRRFFLPLLAVGDTWTSGSLPSPASN